ncbi:MAG: peptidase M14 [Gemmatimonadales bacterium]|nr:MAG: peptidase M14 [Gemmatimonadales bacterium]
MHVRTSRFVPTPAVLAARALPALLISSLPARRALVSLLALPAMLMFAACEPMTSDDPDTSAGPWASGTVAVPADADWSLRAERTEFRETASYDEVVRILVQAARAHPDLHLTHFGYTNEGRALPLLVAGAGLEDGARSMDAGSTEAGPGAGGSSGVATPEARDAAGTLAAEVRRVSAETGRPVVYLQGNIHSGEAAGKEALLRLVRELAHDERPELLSELILLIGPIYNADGNERVDLRNRPRQHGPIGGMGTRANAQGLDLNRDQMKLDSPEARSLAHLMTAFDPHVLVDLHTTNGTRHAYHLTYSPPLHPATPSAIDALLRDDLFPWVTDQFEEAFGWHIWHYGNVGTRGGVRGWYTFDHRPRFVTNYTGLRNRIGILSEAYSYATFADRILASERFVDGILDWIRAHPDRVVEMIRAEDTRDLRGTTIPLGAGFAASAPEHRILMGDVIEEHNPWTGQPILRRTDVVEPDPMPAWVAFEGVDDEIVPRAYLVPAGLGAVVERLRAHGVRLEEAEPGIDLEALADRVAGGDPDGAGELERFRVRTIQRAEQPFQGRNEVAVEGAWEGFTASTASMGSDVPTAGAEWLVVPMDQPLARLAFLLLEPRADDGFTNWGIMDPWLAEGEGYPVLRMR